MTIELALSGLSYSMFCALVSLLIIGLSLLVGAGIIYGFIRILLFIIDQIFRIGGEIK